MSDNNKAANEAVQTLSRLMPKNHPTACGIESTGKILEVHQRSSLDVLDFFIAIDCAG